MAGPRGLGRGRKLRQPDAMSGRNHHLIAGCVIVARQNGAQTPRFGHGNTFMSLAIAIPECSEIGNVIGKFGIGHVVLALHVHLQL